MIGIVVDYIDYKTTVYVVEVVRDSNSISILTSLPCYPILNDRKRKAACNHDEIYTKYVIIWGVGPK